MERDKLKPKFKGFFSVNNKIEFFLGKPGGILSALGGSNTAGGIFGGASTTEKTAGGDGSTLASGGFLSGVFFTSRKKALNNFDQ